MSEFRTVARLDQVPEGSLLGVDLDGVKIVLANQAGEVFALHDQCSHEDFPLSDGELENGQITCLLHGARFDPATGAARSLPAVRPVRVYESRIEDGEPADKVGCVRDFRLQNGDRIRERLLGLSDYDYFCTYSILESPMPLTDYVATLRLTPVTDGERTFVEWSAEFECAVSEAEDLVSGIGQNVFQAGFDALKRQFSG